MRCRVCDAEEATRVGRLQSYHDFSALIFDCAACGSRFAEHRADTYAHLHATPTASYAAHRELADLAQRRFEARDLAGLAELLNRSPAYGFVLGELTALPVGVRLLEVGCSRGYLSSYFVLRGDRLLGIDVSADAIEDARRRFGAEYFEVCGDVSELAIESFDAILHVGTIGCVADPIGMTETLLGLLRPGGVLVFNAPNALLARQLGALWIPGTPPPDLVTLFDPSFWAKRFGGQARVEVTLEPSPPARDVRLAVLRALGRPPQPRAKSALDESCRGGSSGAAPPVSRLARRLLRWGAGLIGRAPFVPRFPMEFGTYVRMQRHVARDAP